MPPSLLPHLCQQRSEQQQRQVDLRQQIKASSSRPPATTHAKMTRGSEIFKAATGDGASSVDGGSSVLLLVVTSFWSSQHIHLRQSWEKPSS
jgi:hypothetical protein